MRDTITVIGRGQAGWHADGVTADGNRFSVTGGDLLSRPWSDGSRVPGVLASAKPGTPVYDAAGADDAAFVRWVLSADATRLGPHLPPGTMAPQWPYPASDAVPCADPASVPDGAKVAPDLYVRLLTSRVPGVRTGVVAGRGKTLRVEWADGSATPYT